MQATGTPADRAGIHQRNQHQRRQLPPALSPARHDTQIPAAGADEEFLARFGDTIDDRIAEILDELLQERNAAHRHRRLRQAPGAVTVILALTASILLRHSAIAWTIWPAAAIIYLATT